MNSFFYLIIACSERNTYKFVLKKGQRELWEQKKWRKNFSYQTVLKNGMGQGGEGERSRKEKVFCVLKDLTTTLWEKEWKP